MNPSNTMQARLGCATSPFLSLQLGYLQLVLLQFELAPLSLNLDFVGSPGLRQSRV